MRGIVLDFRVSPAFRNAVSLLTALILTASMDRLCPRLPLSNCLAGWKKLNHEDREDREDRKEIDVA